MDVFHDRINSPLVKDLLMMVVMNSRRYCTQSLNNRAGSGSNSQDFGAKEKIIFRVSAGVMGTNLVNCGIPGPMS